MTNITSGEKKSSLKNILTKQPFVISISHWLSTEPEYFKYTFNILSEKDQKGGREEKYNLRIQQINLDDDDGKRRVEKEKVNEFIILHLSEKSAVIICDDKVKGKKGKSKLATCIPLQFSRINKCWEGESTCRDICNFLTISQNCSSFGKLVEYACLKMKIQFFMSSPDQGHDDDSSDIGKMKISCHGWKNILLNETKFEEEEEEKDDELIN